MKDTANSEPGSTNEVRNFTKSTHKVTVVVVNSVVKRSCAIYPARKKTALPEYIERNLHNHPRFLHSSTAGKIKK